MRQKKNPGGINIMENIYYVIFAFFIIYFIFLIFFNIITFKKTITVSKIISSYRSGKYGLNLFSDTNGNVYIIKNAPLHLFFKGPELYSSLKENKTYEIKGFGFRNVYIGTYPHIIDMKEVR